MNSKMVMLRTLSFATVLGLIFASTTSPSALGRANPSLRHPRSRFLGSFTNHFDGLPTIHPCGLSVQPTNQEFQPVAIMGSNTGVRAEVLMLENIRDREKQC